MSENFNPQEISIFTKRVERKKTFHRNGEQVTVNQVYHVGNTNIDFDTSDCVVFFYPPKDKCGEHSTFTHKCKACSDSRRGRIVFKKYEKTEEEDPITEEY